MSNPVCIVLGAGPGLGQSIAKVFGQRGFSVAIAARKKATLDTIVQNLGGEGISNVKPFTIDMAHPDSVSATIETITAELGHPHVLVYNGAAARMKTGLDTMPNDVTLDLNIGVVSAVAAVQAVAPSMIEAKSGTILFTGGGFALNPQYGSGIFTLPIQKAGIRAATYALAPTLEPLGIHIATVTVMGTIEKGTPFDPDRIAEAYSRVQQQEQGNWEREIIFDGK